MTPAEQPQACLLHADYHPMADACLAAVVEHSRRHPHPFSRAAWDDYQLQVEQAVLDRHIREHRGLPVPEPVPYTPGPAPAGDMRRVA